MAKEWIKMEKDTPEKPEILAIATALSLDPEVVFTKCFKVWRWADSMTTDGVITRVDPASLDALVHTRGFSDALRDVGWLQARNDSLVIPNFARHMGQSAKKRALTAKRVVTHRKRRCNARRVNTSNLISSSSFHHPTLGEVRALCAERKNSIDPEQFMAFYEANGWVQGKNKPIKDWKAAMRTWERNEAKNKQTAKSAPATTEEIANLNKYGSIYGPGDD